MSISADELRRDLLDFADDTRITCKPFAGDRGSSGQSPARENTRGVQETCLMLRIRARRAAGDAVNKTVAGSWARSVLAPHIGQYLELLRRKFPGVRTGRSLLLVGTAEQNLFAHPDWAPRLDSFRTADTERHLAFDNFRVATIRQSSVGAPGAAERCAWFRSPVPCEGLLSRYLQAQMKSAVIRACTRS